MVEFNVLTYLFYSLSGCIFALLAKVAMSSKKDMYRYGEPQFRKFWIPGSILISYLVIIAVFRVVGDNVGGSDAVNYIRWFKNAFTLGAEEFAMGKFTEPLFHFFLQQIRRFTDDYHVFFFIMYGIISYSYVLFLKKYAPAKISYIPLVLMIWPYIKSFCTLRSSVAIAFLLISLVIYRRNKKIGFVLSILPIFIHRFIIPYIFVIPFLMFIEKKKIILSRKSFLWICISFIVIAFGVSRIIHDNYLNLFLDGADAYYSSVYENSSILDMWPRFLPYVALVLAYWFMYNSIKWDKRTEMIKWLFLFDLFVLPVALYFNIWRAHEIFYIVRMLSWGIILYYYENKYLRRSNYFFNAIVFLLFLTWLYIRFDHEGLDLGITPYIFSI